MINYNTPVHMIYKDKLIATHTLGVIPRQNEGIVIGGEPFKVFGVVHEPEDNRINILLIKGD